MWHLLLIGGLVMFRKQVATVLAPVLSKLPLPESTPQKNNFYGNLITLVTAVFFVLPIEFLGLGGLKRLAFIASLWAVIVTCGLNIKVNYGAPPMPQMTGFSMAAIKEMMPGIQPWLQKVLLSVDFHFLFFSLIFVLATPSMFALLILLRRSFWAVCTFAAKTPEVQGKIWDRTKGFWEKCKAREAEVLQQSALAEVMLGFWLVISIFLPSRQIMTTFLYWNYLKIRFQTPKSQAHHMKAWMQVQNTVQPVLRMAPFLQKPIDMGKEWFKPQYAYQPQ